MKIYIGADHAGFDIKERLKIILGRKHDVTDLGNKKYEKNDDYPVYAAKVARKAAKKKNSFGILICGSGQGVCIAANKVNGIRAALAENERDAYLARRDDDCNVLCLQGRYINLKKAGKIANKFLGTKFKGLKKYKRRITEIKNIES